MTKNEMCIFSVDAYSKVYCLGLLHNKHNYAA